MGFLLALGVHGRQPHIYRMDIHTIDDRIKLRLMRDQHAGYTLVYYGEPKFNTASAKKGEACEFCPNKIKKLMGTMDCFVCRHTGERNVNALICQDMIPIRNSIGNAKYPYPKPIKYKRMKQMEGIFK